MNNVIKRVKRAAFGFRSFRNYRIRVLLYAGKPNWSLLATIAPAETRRACLLFGSSLLHHSRDYLVAILGQGVVLVVML